MASCTPEQLDPLRISKDDAKPRVRTAQARAEIEIIKVPNSVALNNDREIIENELKANIEKDTNTIDSAQNYADIIKAQNEAITA